jgi:hypothetical protein
MKYALTGVVVCAVAGVVVVSCGSSSNGNGPPAGDGGQDGTATDSSGSSSGGSGSSSGSGSGSSSGSSGSSSGGSGSSSGADSGMPADGGDGGSMAFAFPFPPVVAFGGPIITAPNVVTVTFAGDGMATQLASFGATVASSAYWDAVRAGYCIGTSCIGDGPAGTAVALTTAAAASYTDTVQPGGASTLQTALAALISGNTLPAPDDNTIYVLYFPATTTVTLDGAASCNSFDGYHNSMMVGTQAVAYAVVNECPAPMMTPVITTLQNTTITGSHEVAEAASDSSNGFYLDTNNPATWGWNDILGGEIGDLCVDQFGLGLDETTEGGFTVQRIWSINNASAGKNPCVPIPSGEVYFNAYTADSVVVMDVGASKTIQVDALADGVMAPWTLVPQDWTPSTTPYLSFTIQGGMNTDAGTQIQVQSGQSIQLTITLLADPSTSPNLEADGVVVSANGDMTTATAAHFWPFIVVSTAQADDAGITMMRQGPVRPRRLSKAERLSRLARGLR